MAPVATSSPLPVEPPAYHFSSLPSPLASNPIKPFKADPARFPDGLKTSGAHPPLASALRPFSDFPKECTGPTLWDAKDYADQPERWMRAFTQEEVREIEEAIEDFKNSGVPLTGITRDLFPLPNLSSYLGKLRAFLLDGPGFILLRNLPVDRWTLEQSATAYMGIGTYLGYFVSQNGRGHVLGHVKDLGEDPSQPDKVRIYRTNAKQFYHTDSCDIVGLLCIAQAPTGGESDIASTQYIWNELQKQYPKEAEALTQPKWYADRKGEMSTGQQDFYRVALFYLETGQNARVHAKFDPMNMVSLQRHNSGPNASIPPLSDLQKSAMAALEEIANRSSLHMVLQPGDIQFVANSHVFHARTAFTDWPFGAVNENGEERKRRHLMRLWLATPEGEGGWKLALPDSNSKKRMGVQVNDTPPRCPLDAE